MRKIANYNNRQAVLLPGDSLVPPVKGVASTTISYSQSSTVFSVLSWQSLQQVCIIVVINSFTYKRKTNLV